MSEAGDNSYHEDFESWEDHANLLKNKDYPGLVDLCRNEVARCPDDLHAQERLGAAYVLNGQHELAIQAMGQIHQKFPNIESFQYIVLDALFALGKSEEDYEWIQAPRVLRLVEPFVLDQCYEYLRPKRKPRGISELEIELMGHGYLTFTCEELLAALASDRRFFVEQTSDSIWPVVRVRRKKDADQR